MRRLAAGLAAMGIALAAQAQPALQAPASNNPFAGDGAAIEQGRSLYNATCTTCHGANGAAGHIGPGLATPGRSYSRKTDAEIFGAIKLGIPGTAMPPHQGTLSDEQIWKIATYVKGLRGTAIDAPAAGDVSHGEQIFRGKGQCSVCHAIAGKGSVIGPDLSNIAAVRKTNSIIDALTKPGFRVYGPGGDQPLKLQPLPTYPVVRVTKADGRTVRGVLRNEDSFTLQMMGLDEKLYLLDRKTLKKVVYEPNSLMPADYHKRLSETEFADLLAFLTRQTNRPAAVPAEASSR